MKAQAAVKRLNADIKAMHTAQAHEKTALANIQQKEQAILDSFSSNPTPTLQDEMLALKQMLVV